MECLQNGDHFTQPLTQRAVEWVYGYDWLDRLESVKKREATTVAGLALESLQLTSVYQYDAADNRIEFKVPNLQQPALTETFTYSYDDADNILSISKAVGTGSASEIEAFTSDADGNMKTRTSGGVTTIYTWNDFNRLAAISTSDNSKKQSHTFGVNGFRRKKKDQNDVETTEYAAGLATAVSKAQAGDTITYLIGHRLMGFERQSDGAMFWFVTDALNTVRDVVDSSGEVKARYEFSEYGQRLASTENGVSSQKTFVGGMSVQDEVADTGLMLMGHRFYDPSGPAGGTGRFLNRDPIGFQGGLNLFEYAQNSPINFSDSTGLQISTSSSSYDARDLEGLEIVQFNDALGIISVLGGNYRKIAIALKKLKAAHKILISDNENKNKWWRGEGTGYDFAVTYTRAAGDDFDVMYLHSTLLFGDAGVCGSTKGLSQGMLNQVKQVRFRAALKLAGILVHEYEHYSTGTKDENRAYNREYEFLVDYRDFLISHPEMDPEGWKVVQTTEYLRARLADMTSRDDFHLYDNNVK